CPPSCLPPCTLFPYTTLFRSYHDPIPRMITLIVAITRAANTPNTITDPASLNILPPTPRTNPSDRCSIAAEAIALANPVTGMIRSEEHTSELQSRFDNVCRHL